jgi:hypothetical protein
MLHRRRRARPGTFGPTTVLGIRRAGGGVLELASSCRDQARLDGARGTVGAGRPVTFACRKTTPTRTSGDGSSLRQSAWPPAAAARAADRGTPTAC